jgi:hypothetical protein
MSSARFNAPSRNPAVEDCSFIGKTMLLKIIHSLVVDALFHWHGWIESLFLSVETF